MTSIFVFVFMISGSHCFDFGDHERPISDNGNHLINGLRVVVFDSVTGFCVSILVWSRGRPFDGGCVSIRCVISSCTELR